jgi:phage recombination protein Bet
MTPTQTQTKPAAATMATKPAAPAMSDFDKLMSKDIKTRTEFQSFHSETKVTLSIEIVRQYIAVPDKDGGFPDDRQCKRFIKLCEARQLNPFEGDAFMIPFWNSSSNRYEWSLITAHNAFLKRAEVHPDYNGKESGVIVFNEGADALEELKGDFVPPGRTLLGGWCKIHYKNKQHPEYQRLKLETYAKKFGNWTFDAAGMISKCAEAAALRSAFPNTTAGMYLREEMGNGDLTETPPAPMSRPLFAVVPKPSEMPQDEKEGVRTAPTGSKQPISSPVNAPNAIEGIKPDPKPSDQALNVVRSLLKASKIKEAELLGFLAEIGVAEVGCGSLEELDLQSDTALGQIAEQWQDMSRRVLESRQNSEQA